MSDLILRLAILLFIFFGCVAVLEESIYLAIAVVKIPLLVILPVGIVTAFLVFVGQISQTRKGRRYE